MARVLLTSDLHLTDKDRDAYRFEFLQWLDQTCQEHQADVLCILGDLTDAKDRHSAQLVNKIVRALTAIAKHTPIVLLKGNHDYLDPVHPFFQFLQDYDNITYIQDTALLSYGQGRNATAIMGVAHRRNEQDWSRFTKAFHDFGIENPPGLLLLHQTLAGAVASNGFPMEGVSPEAFGGEHPFQVYSGDIHVPQVIGRVTYVGSPYHIHFGDSFEPRVILWERKAVTSIPWDGPKRTTVLIRDPEDLRDQGLRAHDQVKVRVKLPRAYYADWGAYQQRVYDEAETLGILVCGIELVPVKARVKVASGNTDIPTTRTPKVVVEEFAKQENLDQLTTSVGKTLAV